MELTEEKLYAAFGLTPGNQGGNEPEIAEPAAGGQTAPASPQGEREPEPADPATESETDQEEDTEEETAEGEEGEEDNGTEDDADGAGAPGGLQTAEERRANAARRRQQETQAAVNAAVQQALQQQAQQFAAQQQAFFQQAGLTNPFTKQPITNMDEFRAWKQAQEDARIQAELKSGKLTMETLNQMVSEAVQTQTRNAAQEAEINRQNAANQQQAQQFQQDVAAQLAEIRKTDPSIQSLADLLNKPYSNEFYAAVKRGNNYLDAFYLATRNQAAAQAAASARQRTMNSMASKAHMKRTGINGKAGATITPEEEKMYRLFNPNATPEQIQAFQNKTKKG
jgi:hypothetical protein